jgi:uncharacterized protein (TIGR02266 family)
VTPQRTILVVDDAPVFRELGSLFLARSGRVITASYGNEALVAMQRERPDVVVTDLHMPGMDGDALCREIKGDLHLRHTPVIVATSGESADERARAVLAGADDVIAKPIRRLSLIQAVNRFLRPPPLRGLPRVAVQTPVRLQVALEEALGCALEEALGCARNLSRGGIFIEADATPAPETEVGLHFQLPGMEALLAPTARVIWRRRACVEAPAGMGLQFLALDRTGGRRIEEFLDDHEGAQIASELPR